MACLIQYVERKRLTEEEPADSKTLARIAEVHRPSVESLPL